MSQQPTQDNRIFSGSVSIRLGKERTKIDLSPAEEHGGDDGYYRVRIGRRWHDGPDGEMLFLDRSGLADLIAGIAFEEAAEIPAAPPDLPMRSRVSVTIWKGGQPYRESTMTYTPPIRGFDGQFYVGVLTYELGFVFVPVKQVEKVDRYGR